MEQLEIKSFWKRIELKDTNRVSIFRIYNLKERVYPKILGVECFFGEY